MSTARQPRQQSNAGLDSQTGDRAELSPPETVAAASPARRQTRSGRSRSERIATPSGFVYRVHPNCEGQLAGQADSPAADVAGQQSSQLAAVASSQVDLIRLVERQQQMIMELSERLGACQVDLARANERLRTQDQAVGPSVSVLLDQSSRLQQLEAGLDHVRATIAHLSTPSWVAPTLWQSARRWLGQVTL